uniref:C2H2-type domain-containing protein n=1 Tax=Hucho hucho TaxID=62062 RepID=A0A4W5R634_9TELE
TQNEAEKDPPVFHKCPDCGKEFTQANKLERHMRTHTGERPYQCSVCGMRFNQKGNLKTHFKVHTGECPPLPLIHPGGLLANCHGRSNQSPRTHALTGHGERTLAVLAPFLYSALLLTRAHMGTLRAQLKCSALYRE